MLKYLTVYKSVLTTWIKHNIRLNVAILLVSVLSVLAFITCFTFAAAAQRSAGFDFEDHYEVRINTQCDDFPERFADSFPPVKYLQFSNGGQMQESILYLDDDFQNEIRSFPQYARFPKGWEEISPTINGFYRVSEGRDFTEEEVNSASDLIIAAQNSLLKVGEVITVPSLGDGVKLTVIGLSDKFVLPYAFYRAYNYPLNKLSVIFDRPLTEEEVSAGSAAMQSPMELVPGGEAPNSPAYIVSLVAAVVSAVFSALQIFMLFLHLASKSEYQFSVFRVTGCKNKALVFVMLAVTFTYIAFSFILTIPLIFPLSDILAMCGMNGMINARDYVLSFVIYAAAVMAAVLPGYIRAANRSLLKGDG